MIQRNAIAPLLALAALAAGGGCHHLTSKVPGVLDMRTDGSGAAAAPRKAGTGERTGFDGLMYGDGVQGTNELKVTDRKYWVCSFFPIINESATEEITVALGPGGALKNCRIGEQYTIMNWLTQTVVSILPVVSVLNIIMPPHDFYFHGVPVAGASAAVPLPASDTPPPPPPPEAPAPAPDAAAAPTGT